MGCPWGLEVPVLGFLCFGGSWGLGIPGLGGPSFGGSLGFGVPRVCGVPCLGGIQRLRVAGVWGFLGLEVLG